MLHIIYGNERGKSRARFRVLRNEALKKCGTEYVVQEGSISHSFFEEATASQGLFGETTLFVFDNVFFLKEDQEILKGNIDALVASPNHFLIFELEFNKETITDLIKTPAILEEYSAKKPDTRPAFNVFSLGDALGKRNKKDLWVLYQGAITAGFEPEEICNTLFWAVKNMALMKDTPVGKDRGVSHFVASKARGFAKNYSQKEIEDLSRTLVTSYHEAHRGGEPMEVALERFILTL
ncbi:hypothetical protein AUJ77_03715 [Candidatus Nomurabacteria bacterium CG1_02_43_90]|uniref:DNA polymerase III delta N-terminal domain-containing protein n=1 Tax=Candidatus Nomurabacteria bacterium CG1_02_43_90 TaxID=1805281 RepID=A0A1J4V7G2_9BACT|nr:MAG: hypothetical protein AUJ77_03715 [Candidatus Nomurabacteria bacterium CG1_02_43_90]